MKSKHFQDISRLFSLKLLSAFLIVFALLTLFSLDVNAQELSKDIFDDNYNLVEEKLNLISSQSEKYREKDTTESKEISQKINLVFKGYRNALIELQTSEDAYVRDLSLLINAAYARAEAAGKLSWIYYYNLSELKKDSSIEAIKEEYEGYLALLEQKTACGVIEEEAISMCNLLNRSVYTKRLEELIVDSDSFTARKKLSGVIGELESINSSDLLGVGYKEVFERGVRVLELQRARDALIEQARQIFAILRPGESFNENDLMVRFGLVLDNSEELVTMNQAMQKALKELTDIPAGKSYTYLFISELNEAIKNTAEEAAKIGKIGDFLTRFENFDLEYAKVLAKDSIQEKLFAEIELPDGDLLNIEAIFNASGSKIDLCRSKAEIEREEERATFFKALYTCVSSAREDLSIILLNQDKTSFEERISKAFSDASNDLKDLSSANSVFAENCNLILKMSEQNIKLTLNEAKAARFLFEHKDIITKQKEDISLTDENDIRACVLSYLNLQEDVAFVLKSEINSIVEKYKILFAIKIRSLLSNDALYLDLCEHINTEIKELSLNDIGVFFNNTDLVFKKAQTLAQIISKYREATAKDIYSSFTPEEKTALAELCKQAQTELSATELSDTDIFDSALDKVLKNTIICFSRISEYARVRVSARNDEDLEIKKLLAEAKSKISSSDNKNDMEAIADATIYKINRILTVKEMKARADYAEQKINEMRFLPSAQKSEFIAKLKSLRESTVDKATLAENVTVLGFEWNNFNDSLDKLFESANQTDLSLSREHHTKEIEKALDTLTTDISALAHLSSVRREEIIKTLNSLAEKFKIDILLCADSNAVAALYDKTLGELNSLKLGALAENLENYKTIVLAELEKFKSIESQYSEKNFGKILSIIDQAKQKLANATSISDCSLALQWAQNEIHAVNDLLDDAKNEARNELDTLINLCRTNASHYSNDKQKILQSIYSEALTKIASFDKISEIGLLNSTADEYITKIKAVRKDRIYTSEEATVLFEPNVQYPQGYDFSLGFWASIYSPDNIAFDSILSVKNSNSSDLKKIQSLVRKAARKDRLILSTDISESELKLLEKGVISLGLDLSLSNVAAGKSYTLQMLLPNDLRNENILGIVFIDTEGRVEFYSAKTQGELLSANLSHFSDYYIVSEKTTDLTPLLIFLIVLLSLELIALGVILVLRTRRRRKEIKMLPQSFLYSIMPISALAIKPQNAVGLAILLSIAVLALGCGIAFLAKLEFDAQKRIKRRPYPQSAKSEREETEERLLSEEQTLRLHGRAYYLHEGSDVCSSTTATATATECENAFSYTEEGENEEHTATGSRFFSHRAEINLDIIADNFKAGELVTLEALKKKRLVSRKADHIKILARGSLTKPLIVEAHDFSRAAEKMLTAVGGEAIRIK